MTLFWPVFDHLLDRLICVCLILRPNYGHIWVKHEKSVQKVVQKWVISGVPRSAEPPKVDILASKHQIWHFGVSKNDPFLAKKWQKMGHFLDPFFVIFDPFSRWRVIFSGSRNGSEVVQKVVQKWSFLGVSKMAKTGRPQKFSLVSPAFLCHFFRVKLVNFAIFCSGSYLRFLAKNRPILHEKSDTKMQERQD